MFGCDNCSKQNSSRAVATFEATEAAASVVFTTLASVKTITSIN